jgi:hypothetical protein
MGNIGKFLKRDRQERVALVEAMFWLCLARLLLLIVPFRWIAPHLGRQMTESPFSLTGIERAIVQRTSWAVQAVARRAPLGFVCLPQAMAAKWMLRRQKLESTLYLGLRRGDEANIAAHAWLRAGDRVLTGHSESLGHQVIATFGD